MQKNKNESRSSIINNKNWPVVKPRSLANRLMLKNHGWKQSACKSNSDWRWSANNKRSLRDASRKKLACGLLKWNNCADSNMKIQYSDKARYNAKQRMTLVVDGRLFAAGRDITLSFGDQLCTFLRPLRIWQP